MADGLSTLLQGPSVCCKLEGKSLPAFACRNCSAGCVLRSNIDLISPKTMSEMGLARIPIDQHMIIPMSRRFMRSPALCCAGGIRLTRKNVGVKVIGGEPTGLHDSPPPSTPLLPPSPKLVRGGGKPLEV